MHRITSVRTATLAVLVFFTTTATTRAQTGEIGATYPFGASHAVASDPELDLVFAGLGSGIMLLDGSSAQPSLYDPGATGTVNSQLRPRGFVREMDFTDEHLYVAAGKSGLVRYDRAVNYVENWTFKDQLQDIAHAPDAWALSVDRIGGLDSILLGTHDHGDIGGCPTACDDDGTGTLFLLRLDPTDPDEQPQILDSVNVPAPIYAVESMLVGDTLTVLVGTACNGGSSTQGSLLRYDWENVSTTPPLAIPAMPAGWSVTESGTPLPTFVHDVVLDDSSTPPTAYVAASSRGLHKPALPAPANGGGFTEITGPKLPIVPHTTPPALFTALALHDLGGTPYLVAALGPPLHQERQIWGCSHVLPCDDASVASYSEYTLELRLYDPATGDCLKTLGATLESQCTDPNDPCYQLLPRNSQPVDVAARPAPGGSSNSFRVDLSTIVNGVQTIEVVDDPVSGWKMTRVGSWGKHPQIIPAGSMDDVIQLGSNLYVGVEPGVVAFRADMAPSDPEFLREMQVPYTNGPGYAVLLEGFTPPAQPDRQVLVGRGNNGVRLFNVDLNWGLATGITDGGVISDATPGEVWRGYGMDLLDSSPSDGLPWVVLCNASDPTGGNPRISCQSGGEPSVQGGVHVFRLQDLEGPEGPDGLWTAGEATELGWWAEPACSGSGVPVDDQDSDGYFVGCRMFHVGPGAQQGSDVYAILVAYGPRNLETGAGLMVLRAIDSETTVPEGELTIEWHSKVEAIPDACEDIVSRIGYPLGSAGLLGVALGCNGVAFYDVSDPLDPVLVSTWSDGNPCGAGSLASLHLADSPIGNAAAVTFINMDIGGIGFYDFTTLDMVGDIVPTTFNANALLPYDDPGATDPSFLVTDGAGGLHFMTITGLP